MKKAAPLARADVGYDSEHPTVSGWLPDRRGQKVHVQDMVAVDNGEVFVGAVVGLHFSWGDGWLLDLDESYMKVMRPDRWQLGVGLVCISRLKPGTAEWRAARTVYLTGLITGLERHEDVLAVLRERYAAELETLAL